VEEWGAVPRLCEFYSDICLTTEEKARKNLSQGTIQSEFLKHPHYCRIYGMKQCRSKRTSVHPYSFRLYLRASNAKNIHHLY